MQLQSSLFMVSGKETAMVFSCIFLFMGICSLGGVQAVNVAQGQMASQYADLNYNGFLWTANKSVDGDLRRDNPDTDRSCSANVGSGINNYWRVDLSRQYNVESIVIYGREGGGGEGQLSNFDLYVTSEDTEQETLVYNNTGVAYGDGVFTVNFSPVIPVTSAVIRRPTGNILVLCEVQIFDVPTTTGVSTTSSITVSSSPVNTATSTGNQSSTQSESTPITTGGTAGYKTTTEDVSRGVIIHISKCLLTCLVILVAVLC